MVTTVQLIASDTEKAVVDHSVLEDVGFLEDGPVAKVSVLQGRATGEGDTAPVPLDDHLEVG